MLQLVVGTKYTLKISEYEKPEPRRVAIKVLVGDIPWGSLSVNLRDEPCESRQFFAKEYAENASWAPELLETMVRQGLIVDTGVTVSLCYVSGIRKFEMTGLCDEPSESSSEEVGLGHDDV